MKFLFLISRFLDGGIDTVLVEYLNAMVRLTDHEVTLAITLKMNEAEVFLSRIDRRVKIEYLVDEDWLTAYKRKKHHHQKNALLGAADEIVLNPIRRMLTKQRLAKLSREMDVVIDFDACHASFIDVVPKDAKTFVWFHFSLEHEARRSPKRMKRLGRQFAKYDKIVLIADAMLEEARRLYPQYADKYCRIYNCLNKELIEQKATEKEDDERINKPFVLAVERLEENQKDITTLIKAYAKFLSVQQAISNPSSLIPNPYLYIIGEGRSRADLERLIADLHLEDKVHLLGFKSNPYPWMKASQMLVHSSKFEGLPTVLIEGMLLKKFVICTDCPTGPVEILDHGKAGILVPMNEVDAFAEAIQEGLKDTSERKAMLADAAEHSKLFLPETSIHDLLKLCE